MNFQQRYFTDNYENKILHQLAKVMYPRRYGTMSNSYRIGVWRFGKL